MPEPGDDAHRPRGSLDDRLAAFEASRQRVRAPLLGASSGAAADGYRLVALMLGGIFGGVGLGWLVDHFAHTRPFGIVAGFLIGAVAAVVSTVRTAVKMGERSSKTAGAVSASAADPAGAPAPNDEDED